MEGYASPAAAHTQCNPFMFLLRRCVARNRRSPAAPCCELSETDAFCLQTLRRRGHLLPRWGTLLSIVARAASARPNRLKAMFSRMNLSPIRDLRSEKPVTKAGQIRRAWADIKAAIDAGHSLKTVAERLRDCGIDVRYRALTVYVSRLRREDSSGRLPAPTQAKTAAAGRKRKPVPADVFDPLRNVKEREENRPGFQFDPEPDPRKLI